MVKNGINLHVRNVYASLGLLCALGLQLCISFYNKCPSINTQYHKLQIILCQSNAFPGKWSDLARLYLFSAFDISSGKTVYEPRFYATFNLHIYVNTWLLQLPTWHSAHMYTNKYNFCCWCCSNFYKSDNKRKVWSFMRRLSNWIESTVADRLTSCISLSYRLSLFWNMFL